METIGFGVIGCGEHALRGHVLPAVAMDVYSLVAVSDPNVQAVNAALREADLAGVTVRDDLSLLEDPRVEAVLIATPDAYHAELLKKAVLAGKHVMCEKPLAVTEVDLVSIETSIRLATERSLVVTSCHPRRFDPPYLWVKNRLVDWVVSYGDLLDVALDFTYHRPSKTGLHEGLLIDHISHEIDILNWLLGFSNVSVAKRHDDQTRYKADGVRLSDGITFSFHGTRMLDSRVYPEAVRLRFERADITVWSTGNCIVVDHSDGSIHQLDCPKVDYDLRFTDLMADWAKSIRTGTPSYLTGRDLIMNSAIGMYLTRQYVWESSY